MCKIITNGTFNACTTAFDNDNLNPVFISRKFTHFLLKNIVYCF